MTIKVGDKFRDKGDGDTGEVIAIWRGLVVVGWERNGCAITYDDDAELLRDATPIAPEPAPAPLTGAQVAQVFDRLRHYLTQVAGEQPGFGLGDMVRALRLGAERERDRG